MIKLKKADKTDFEKDLYEARVEEALARWETALKTANKQWEIPRPKKADSPRSFR